MMHVGERSVALHEHVGINGDTELVAQLDHPIRLMLASAICEEDEGDTLRLQVRQGFVGARQGIRASYEHAVDTDNRQ